MDGMGTGRAQPMSTPQANAAEAFDARPLCVVAASFTAAPLQEPLERALAAHALDCRIALAQYADLPRYLLAPGELFGTHPILASIVLLRLEDWLRASAATGDEARWRTLLGERSDETLAQITAASARGPVFVVCCPSRGAIARRTDSVVLCHTLGAVLWARLRRTTRALLLPWQAFEDAYRGRVEFDDPGADRLGQVPFTQACFDAWAGHAARALAAGVRGTRPAQPTLTEVGALESYLASLEAHVSLRPWSAADRPDAERLLATVAGFRSAGASAGVWSPDGDRERWIVRLVDRTGDYGACGLLVLRTHGGVLAIDGFLLSCPVLGKRVEQAVVLGLTRLAQNRRCDTLRFSVEPSAGQQLVVRFLESFAAPDHDTHAPAYVCDTAQAVRALTGLAHATCEVAGLS